MCSAPLWNHRGHIPHYLTPKPLSPPQTIWHCTIPCHKVKPRWHCPTYTCQYTVKFLLRNYAAESKASFPFPKQESTAHMCCTSPCKPHNIKYWQTYLGNTQTWPNNCQTNLEPSMDDNSAVMEGHDRDNEAPKDNKKTQFTKFEDLENRYQWLNFCIWRIPKCFCETTGIGIKPKRPLLFKEKPCSKKKVWY